MSDAIASSRKQQWSWAFYDWANSAWATTVLAGFFPVFFNRYWADGVAPTTQTLYLGVGSAVASLLVMVMAPYVGALADKRRWKKKLLLGFTVLGVISTAAFVLVEQGQWLPAIILFVLGSIGFFGGLSVYDALLVDVAPPEKTDRVSALGYGLGYLGGGVLFAINVAMVLKPQVFGLANAAAATQASFISVAIWWALFSIPLFKNVQEKQANIGEGSSWAQLLQTLSELKQHKSVLLFLVAYWFYIDGAHTIIRMAVDYGMKLGFPSNSLMIALLFVQFISFPSAIFFGWLGERIGTQRALFITLAVYVLITGWAYTMTTVSQFYMMAAVVGLVQGGIQSLSRSFFARIIPQEKSGQFFGFYNMLGKFAAVLGPLAVGVTAQLTGNPRIAILSLLVFFVIGGVLLSRVKDPVKR